MSFEKEQTVHTDNSTSPQQNDAYLDVKHLTKKYGKMVAVNDVSFTVGRDKIVTLLGPSGCGKSTTLRCVAGLEGIDEGIIKIDGKTVSSAKDNINIPPEKRDIGMVFQSYAVWPHMTVWENVAYPLQIHKVNKSEINDRVDEILAMVGLREMAERNVTRLSGGQQQRVVLARAMVHNPRILLFDEPLSNLDARLRVSMRFEIRRLQQKIGVAALYVTHDQSEAMVISDNVIVMNNGEIEQFGTPLEIYKKPATSFIAQFFGEVNFIEATVLEQQTDKPWVSLKVNDGRNEHYLFADSRERFAGGEKVNICIRPQDVAINIDSKNGRQMPSMYGRVKEIVHMGTHVEYYIDTEQFEICHHNMQELQLKKGDRIQLSFNPESCICVSH